MLTKEEKAYLNKRAKGVREDFKLGLSRKVARITFDHLRKMYKGDAKRTEENEYLISKVFAK